MSGRVLCQQAAVDLVRLRWSWRCGGYHLLIGQQCSDVQSQPQLSQPQCVVEVFGTHGIAAFYRAALAVLSNVGEHNPGVCLHHCADGHGWMDCNQMLFSSVGERQQHYSLGLNQCVTPAARIYGTTVSLASVRCVWHCMAYGVLLVTHAVSSAA